MAMIVAVCPYCRAGGVRAPESAVGASANCPKCGSSFTLMPSEGAPGWNSTPAAAAKPSSTTVPAVPAQTSQQATLSRPDDTRPAAAMGDKTIPAPHVAGTARPEIAAPAPAPAPTPISTSPDDDDEATDYGLVVALSALALVGVAVVATQLPYGRFVATAVAGLGLVGGLASLGAEGRARMAGAAACGLHSLILLFVLLLPSWIGLNSWRELVIVNEPPAPQAFSHKNYQTSLAQWVDSSAASWQFDDVRVTVAGVAMGPVELTGPMGARLPSKDQFLTLTLRIDNFGPKRGIDLTGWALGQNPETVQISDSNGKVLKPAEFEGEWRPETPPSNPVHTLYPGKFREVRLLFAAPPQKFDYLRLILPGTVFGFKSEEVKFQISAGSIAMIHPAKK